MKQIATIFKALGDETRLEIVRMLLGKELCVCDILDAFNKTQPAISHHLKILKHAGIVNDVREGKWIFYSINHNAIKDVQAFIQKVMDTENVKERCHPCAATQLPQD